MQEFKAVFFEEDALEYQGMSILIALLPLMAKPDFKFKAKKPHKFQEPRVCLKQNAINLHFDRKNE